MKIKVTEQLYDSGATSVNATKLPAVYGKIRFDHFLVAAPDLLTVFDYGCGKYDNARDFVVDTLGGFYLPYDKYNRPESDNEIFLRSLHEAPETIDMVVCSNVLNVIMEDEIIQGIADEITRSGCVYFISVYEGNRSGVGAPTRRNSYQRNERLAEYLRFFPGAVAKHGVISNYPDFIK